MLNEHVVATTLLCLSNINIDYAIGFSVEADLDHRAFHHDWRDLAELEGIFEVENGDHLGGEVGGDPALQRLGRIQLRDGRLLAMPSVLRRDHSAYPTLIDPNKPGKLQLLTLRLVDPHYRICSTRNVPPQQHGWWASAAGLEAVFSRLKVSDGHGVPQEVVEQIRSELGQWPMGDQEVLKAFRAREDDRYTFQRAVEKGTRAYDFDWD
jgi:hypothetical protein